MMKMSGNDDFQAEEALRRALLEIHPAPALSQAQADDLREKIVRRAELPLARRRRLASEKSRAGREWSRRLVPIAAAASLAFGIWFGEISAPPAGGGIAIQDIRAFLSDSDEEILQADVTEQEFRLLVSGRADPDGLLLIAIGEI
jgi:hypothetical protein